MGLFFFAGGECPAGFLRDAALPRGRDLFFLTDFLARDPEEAAAEAAPPEETTAEEAAPEATAEEVAALEPALASWFVGESDMKTDSD